MKTLKIIKLTFLCILLLTLLTQPGFANNTEFPPKPLNLDILKQRIKSPINQKGILTIDLQNFIIDLTQENAEFRDNFYQLLQTNLNQPGAIIGLDLSKSIIKGEFIANKIGLRTPLVGEALSPLFTPAELEQLEQDKLRLSLLINYPAILSDRETYPRQITVFRGNLQLTETRFANAVNFNNTFFLNRFEADATIFENDAKFSKTRFRNSADFNDAIFANQGIFTDSIFFDLAKFKRSQFLGEANFKNSQFIESADFAQTQFFQQANFQQVSWEKYADFSDSQWQDSGIFAKSHFGQYLSLNQASFQKSVTFRKAIFNKSINLESASIESSIDFSDAQFAKDAYLNMPELTFDSDDAKIMGDLGKIGLVIRIPTLAGNHNLLRNLVRNFRLQEQIPDANQLENLRARLRLRELRECLFGAEQTEDKFLLSCQNNLTAKSAIKFTVNFRLISIALQWFWLSLLLLLSGYGTSFWLVFGVGLIAIAYFALLFWFLDRWRRRSPKPAILPNLEETVWMLGSFSIFNAIGSIAIFSTSPQPFLTLVSLGVVILPIPIILLGIIYWRGRYHDLMNVSYFTEYGGMRQLRLAIARLPIMPRFPFFRDRYMNILWNSRWNWLNYYDFSLNNLLKFGFNDIRLRDEHIPGLIASLVWYQWGLGILYFILLLWTLSRTIPGLNLLIYF